MSINNDKVALVTGSTHGIGKAILIELARNGYKVVINGASTNELTIDYRKLLDEIYKEDSKNNYIFIQANIANVEERKKMINKIREKFNRIDVLVNNAGVAPSERKDILEASEDSFERILRINLQGPYFLTQIIANWMISLQNTIEEDYQPYIINISSISSFTSSPNRGEYCISKAGISMMTKLYADRLAEYFIPVYEIQPGIIKTRMTKKVEEKYNKLIKEGIIPIKRWGLPVDIAKTVLAIVKGNIPYSTGDIIHIDGGFHLHRL